MTSQHRIVQGVLHELHGAFGTDVFERRAETFARMFGERSAVGTTVESGNPLQHKAISTPGETRPCPQNRVDPSDP